ncbi:MAG: UDP-N-acetylmuramoyl-L-alanine--D-glutamate ligase [Methanobacterium sp.]|nr:UDP-N-acetylmuramoyl-L-alanine--D-glutamate ligase [Methanobacterium sp.]
MKVAVLGLGMEGKKSVKALLEYGASVYASDLDKNLDLSEFESSDLDVDLGFHDKTKVDESDCVVLSPSLWNKSAINQIVEKNKLFSDVLNGHKSIFTIGVTGTNGKTTSCHMIHEILVAAGYKVLMGGNAGGGFDGYTQLTIQANESDYDVIIVEVCDMTLDFASRIFDFNMVLVTNIGFDHMEHHQSMENYQSSVEKFLSDVDEAVLNGNDPLLIGCESKNTHFFDTEVRDLKLFGSFNQENASGAFKVASILGVKPELINEVLSNFEAVEGRTRTLKLNGSEIIIGKTDNPDSTALVLSEAQPDIVIIGTPRRTEKFRYNILKEVAMANPSEVVLFPGLDDTTEFARKILIDFGYKGTIVIAQDPSTILDLVLDYTENNDRIFIGGNGQSKIMSLQSSLLQLVDE